MTNSNPQSKTPSEELDTKKHPKVLVGLFNRLTEVNKDIIS